MNPRGKTGPQSLRTSEETGKQSEEDNTFDRDNGDCSNDRTDRALNQTSSNSEKPDSPGPTTLRHRRRSVLKVIGRSEGTMIPLRNTDVERAVVRRDDDDDEIMPLSAKHSEELEEDSGAADVAVDELTRIRVVDRDHPETDGPQPEVIVEEDGNNSNIIKVKVISRPPRRSSKSKSAAKSAKVQEAHSDDDDLYEEEPKAGCTGGCGSKWKEHHFEFELDVSALQERAAERAERLAEQAREYAEQAREYAEQAREQAGRYVGKVKQAAWRVMPHTVLPEWMKDNEFLQDYHRPPMPSFKQCFRSIFRIHTETGNIWTHLIGFIMFIILMVYFLITSILGQETWQKIAVYMAFFMGATTCLFCSFFFHTCACHSVKVANICSKLDYSGITFLIVGSFVPWLYFGFYCEELPWAVYSSFIIVLGIVCLVVSMKDTFATPKYRPCRAALFISLGLSAVIPAIHYIIQNSFLVAVEAGAIGWMILMGALYIGGAMLYALRIPERFFPGKCDVWFQSHQFFHVLVVVAAMVHFHALNTMAAHREEVGECQAEFTTPETLATVLSY